MYYVVLYIVLYNDNEFSVILFIKHIMFLYYIYIGVFLNYVILFYLIFHSCPTENFRTNIQIIYE